MIQTLYRWWRDNASNGAQERANLHLADFVRVFPYLLITDVEQETFRVRYRLVGPQIVEAIGLDITGYYLDELMPAGADEPGTGHYALCYCTRRPVFGTSTARTTSGFCFAYEFGIFPLRKSGTYIEQFATIVDCFQFSQFLPDLLKWRVRPIALPWIQPERQNSPLNVLRRDCHSRWLGVEGPAANSDQIDAVRHWSDHEVSKTLH